VSVTLYWMTVSHPSQAARRMVELKGIDHKLVTVMPMAQKAYLRAVGFSGGTVPAMKVDGKRVQGSRQIARALDRTDGATKVLLHRAIRQLEEMVSEPSKTSGEDT